MNELKTSVVLFYAGNFVHANVLDPEKVSVNMSEAIRLTGKCGFPVTVSNQGIDGCFTPEKKEFYDYPNIEVVNAPYGHGLITLSPEEVQKWQLSKNVGCVRGGKTTFFPEFSIPKPWHIPTEFFLILKPLSHFYSLCATGDNSFHGPRVKPGGPSVSFGGKIGIIVQGFDDILKTYFLFQRFPDTKRSETDNKRPLDHLLDLLEALAESKERKIVIWPIDLEAPEVGSLWDGNLIRKMLFDAVNNRGLNELFVPLSSLYDEFRERAIPSSQPHRDLGNKFTNFRDQILHVSKLYSLIPQTPPEFYLHDLASISDYLACVDREERGDIILDATYENGSEGKVVIGYNPDIKRIALAARLALTLRLKKSEVVSFPQALNRIIAEDKKAGKSVNINSFILRRVLQYAEEKGI